LCGIFRSARAEIARDNQAATPSSSKHSPWHVHLCQAPVLFSARMKRGTVAVCSISPLQRLQRMNLISIFGESGGSCWLPWS
jgi:hypothetical protein